MAIALIIAGGALALLLFVAFAIWAHQYTKVGPNEVLIISGRRARETGRGYRIVRGGGTFVTPWGEKIQRLSLELLQFDVRTQETYTSHGVPVHIDGVCMVKVDGTDHGIERAAESFLSHGPDDIVRTAMQAVEGHMRTAVGALSIEDIYRERQRLISAVRSLAEPDLERMGLTMVSLTIRNVADKQGYLEALGRPRTAQVKRDAIRGEAAAEREARAARYEADLAIEASRRDFETEKAVFKAEGRRAAARADLAYDLERLDVEIVERRKRIELMDAEVERRRRELEFEIEAPAQARAREILALAEAHRERMAAEGRGEAEALRAKGLAEADAMAAKAHAWGSYNEAAITDRVLEILPELAAAVSAPLARTEKIVMIGGGNGSSSGAADLTGDVSRIVAQLPEVLEALTGLKFGDIVKRVPGLRGDGVADGEAEEVR
jgi:flotillin